MESLWVFVLFHIEEGAALAFCGLTLLGFRPDLNKTLLMGILQGTAAYLATSLVYSFDLPPFISSIILLGTLIGIIKAVTGIRLGMCTAAGFLAFLVLFISQLLFAPAVNGSFGIIQQGISGTPILRVAAGYTGDALLFTLALATGFTGISLVKSPEADAEFNFK